MVLGKGVLLAHAKTKDGVLASSAALTLFEKPITMQSGKEIRCIICLAPQNQKRPSRFLGTATPKAERRRVVQKPVHQKQPRGTGILYLDDRRRKRRSIANSRFRGRRSPTVFSRPAKPDHVWVQRAFQVLKCGSAPTRAFAKNHYRSAQRKSAST